MASSSSFDVVSDFDRQEMVNAVDQVLRELKNRYDLKNTGSTVELGENLITITTNNEMTLETLAGILREKAAKRKLSQKIFEYGKIEGVSGGKVRQEITLKRGIEKELGKTITKLVRDQKMKVQAAIQGMPCECLGSQKNDLQTIMQLLREQDYPVALQFENYR